MRPYHDTLPLLTKSSLELGAGGGLTGLALALALQRSRTTLPNPLLITDLPILLSLQEQNIALNGLDEDIIKSHALPWGSPLPLDLPQAYRRPDIILAADCVYFEPAFPLLVETLSALVVDTSAEILFCYKKRRKVIESGTLAENCLIFIFRRINDSSHC